MLWRSGIGIANHDEHYYTALGRICYTTTVIISICYAIIGFKILIFRASGLQITMSKLQIPMSIRGWVLLIITKNLICIDNKAIFAKKLHIIT